VITMPESMTRPDAEAYLDQFIKDFNALLAQRMNGKNTIGAAESGIIRNAMLHLAGYLEAMQHAGFEAADTLGALPPQLRPLLTRMTPHEVYGIYTGGYNHGIRVADDNSHEILGTMQRWTESERSAAPKETPP